MSRPHVHYLTYQGERLPATVWAQRRGIAPMTLKSRKTVYGMSDAEAIETPVKPRRHYTHIEDAIAAYLERHPEEAERYA